MGSLLHFILTPMSVDATAEGLLEAFVRYMAYERNASEQTLVGYRGDLEAYIAYCRERLGEEFAPSAGDLDLVRGWLSGMMDRGGKASSVARRLSSAKSWYRYLVKVGYLSSSPIVSLKAPRQERPLPAYVPTSELERILEPVESPSLREVRDRLVVATLYECGLRRSELAALRTIDVDLERRSLKVVGKGDKERIVPFGISLAQMMQQWSEIRDREFGGSDSFFLTLKGKPMKGSDVYSIVRAQLASVPNLARRGAHTLRHSFATDMLNSGADLLKLKELMGHSSVATTVQYTHTSFRQLQQVYHAHPRAQNNTTIMDIRIQALHFDATEQLKEFIRKKLDKLNRFADDIQAAEVLLKVVKPEVSENKEASVKLLISGNDLFVDKVADTFEEAIDLCVDVLKRGLEKRKEAHK